ELWKRSFSLVMEMKAFCLRVAPTKNMSGVSRQDAGLESSKAVGNACWGMPESSFSLPGLVWPGSFLGHDTYPHGGFFFPASPSWPFSSLMTRRPGNGEQPPAPSSTTRKAWPGWRIAGQVGAIRAIAISTKNILMHWIWIFLALARFLNSFAQPRHGEEK